MNNSLRVKGKTRAIGFVKYVHSLVQKPSMLPYHFYILLFSYLPYRPYNFLPLTSNRNDYMPLATCANCQLWHSLLNFLFYMYVRIYMYSMQLLHSCTCSTVLYYKLKLFATMYSVVHMYVRTYHCEPRFKHKCKLVGIFFLHNYQLLV